MSEADVGDECGRAQRQKHHITTSVSAGNGTNGKMQILKDETTTTTTTAADDFDLRSLAHKLVMNALNKSVELLRATERSGAK